MKKVNLTIEQKEIYALRYCAKFLNEIESESSEIDLAKTIKSLEKEADNREKHLRNKDKKNKGERDELGKN